VLERQKCVCRLGIGLIVAVLIVALPGAAQTLTNDKLSVKVNPKDGSYQLAVRDGQPTLNSRAAAQVDHQWLRSSDYPRCEAASSVFSDALGSGHQIAVNCSGSAGKPDLAYIVQLYDQSPYGTVQVKVHNSTGKAVTV